MKNSFGKLGRAKALLPEIWSRKTETSREMGYAEIKAIRVTSNGAKVC